jgi:putative ABC transport system substrate-binding protein
VSPGSPRTARIGYLANRLKRNGDDEVFFGALRQRGWVEAQNLSVEFRWAGTDPAALSSSANELVQKKVELIAALGTVAVLPARRATASIPIVMINVNDPVGLGLMSNLAHPGGNVTGTGGLLELNAKRLELFKQALQSLSHVVALTRAMPALSRRCVRRRRSPRRPSVHVVCT